MKFEGENENRCKHVQQWLVDDQDVCFLRDKQTSNRIRLINPYNVSGGFNLTTKWPWGPLQFAGRLLPAFELSAFLLQFLQSMAIYKFSAVPNSVVCSAFQNCSIGSVVGCFSRKCIPKSWSWDGKSARTVSFINVWEQQLSHFPSLILLHGRK